MVESEPEPLEPPLQLVTETLAGATPNTDCGAAGFIAFRKMGEGSAVGTSIGVWCGHNIGKYKRKLPIAAGGIE